MKIKHAGGPFQPVNPSVAAITVTMQGSADTSGASHYGGGDTDAGRGGRLTAAQVGRIRARNTAGTAGPGKDDDGGDGYDASAAPAPGTAGAAPAAPAAAARPAPKPAAVAAAPAPDDDAGDDVDAGVDAVDAAPEPPAPAAAKPAETQSQREMDLAIQLERSARAAEVATERLRSTNAEIERMRADLARAESDPLAFAASRGKAPEEVVSGWLDGDKADKGDGAEPARQTSDARSQRDTDPAVKALQEQVAALTAQITGDVATRQKNAKVESLRSTIASGGEEYASITALGAEDAALAFLEQAEERAGQKLGPVETLRTLEQFDKGIRENVEKQAAKLVKLPWAQEAFRKALDGAAGARPAPAATAPRATKKPASPQAQTPPDESNTGTAATAAPQSAQQGSLHSRPVSELRQAARARVASLLRDKGVGLG